MTLIAVYNSDGCVGRCDARCYNATSGPCDCICGGKNHGAGIQTAQANTGQMAQGWIEKYEKENGKSFSWKVNPITKQLALPLGG